MRIARHTAYFKLYVCPLADLDTPPRLSVQNMSEFFGKQLKAAVTTKSEAALASLRNEY